MVKLIIEDDEGKTTVVPLIRDEITIGRKEGNTIRLTERNVSRRHAKLLKLNGAIFIEDLDSYNGIKVNGNRIGGRVAVAEGDRIQIGDYVLGLKLEGKAEKGSPVASNRTLEIPASEQEAEREELPRDLPAETEVTEKIPKRDEAPEAPAAAPQPSPEEVGRVVCVSSNFAGQEWFLDKPLMVLGRTEDNDVVINHRSISRHHARITEEAGRYTIKDLQSSNGVRVNGEEYDKVELRRGDLIDLGHVRLRFIAPGEDFVFSRDASVVDISRGGGSRGGIWIAMTAALLVVGGFFLWRMNDGKEPKNTTTPVARVQQPDTAAQPAATATADAAKPALSNLVTEITQAVSTEQWGAAVSKCNQLTGDQKTLSQANCDRAVMEMAAQEDFEKANAANIQHEFETVLIHLKNIPEQSIYRSRDDQIFERAKTEYLAQAHERVEKMVEAGKCEAAEQINEKVQELVGDSGDIEELAQKCQERKLAAAKRAAQQQRPRQPRPQQPRHKKPPTKRASVDKPDGSTNPDLSDMTKAKQILSQATEAYVAGNHNRAHSLARQVLRLVPRNMDAIQLIGASSCFLKNTKDAKWAYDRLPPVRRNLLKKVCLRNGVTL